MLLIETQSCSIDIYRRVEFHRDVRQKSGKESPESPRINLRCWWWSWTKRIKVLSLSFCLHR